MDELRATGLSVRAGDRVLLNGVDLTVPAGRVTALVGPSGSGKSVTARALVGRIPCRPGLVGGTVSVGDTTPRTEAEWATLRGAGVALLPQDARGGLDPLRTVGTQVGSGLPRAAHHDGVARLLAAAGLGPEVAALYPYELSGGMAQRAALAVVLAHRPRFLIADEPTTGLDAIVQRAVAGTLAVQAAAGVGVLLITHDLRLVTGLAHEVVVMIDGRIVDHAPSPLALRGPGRALVDATRRIAGGSLG